MRKRKNITGWESVLEELFAISGVLIGKVVEIQRVIFWSPVKQQQSEEREYDVSSTVREDSEWEMWRGRPTWCRQRETEKNKRETFGCSGANTLFQMGR